MAPRRPSVGEPQQSDFAFETVTVPDPGPGQIVVRNDYMSVDPYMRGRMNEGESYIAQFELGEAMTGSAVGTVVASQDAGVPVGATVTHFLGWREYALLDAAQAQLVDTELAPARSLRVLGTTGLTAWASLRKWPRSRRATSSSSPAPRARSAPIAGQLARKLGAAKVIGSAGGPAKAKRRTEDFGFDVALDYREGDIAGSSPRRRPTASTSTSTTSAATTSTPRCGS